MLTSRTLAWLVALALVGAGGWLIASRASVVGRSRAAHVQPCLASYEEWARSEFERRYPGERPLNWKIGEVAVRFHNSQPMGKFVLGLGPDEWGNDCSDFVDCVVDEGLGVGARFRHGSDHHLLARDARLWERFYWRPGLSAQPGDVVAVRHSPWYEPYEGACWHVGIIGSDGMVYDFVKLKRWKAPRYGRHSFQWFVHNSLGPRQVIMSRLAAKYRYRIQPLPRPLPFGSSRISPKTRRAAELGEDDDT